MKFIYAALFAVAMTLPGVSTAQNTTSVDVVRTAQLLELCSALPEESEYVAAMAFCMGYIDAALDYHAALTGTGRSTPITCPPATVTREEVVVVVRDWGTNSGAAAGDGSPVEGVMQAVTEKWPCQ